jgi:hypothetical protein
MTATMNRTRATFAELHAEYVATEDRADAEPDAALRSRLRVRVSILQRAMWHAGMLEGYGLTPWQGGDVCIRRVVGKRHLYRFDGTHCDCDLLGEYRDHGRLWRDAARNLVVTFEPYRSEWLHGHDDDAPALLRRCAELGISVEFAPFSPYYCEATQLLIFRRAST